MRRHHSSKTTNEIKTQSCSKISESDNTNETINATTFENVNEEDLHHSIQSNKQSTTSNGNSASTKSWKSNKTVKKPKKELPFHYACKQCDFLADSYSKENMLEL